VYQVLNQAQDEQQKKELVVDMRGPQVKILPNLAGAANYAPPKYVLQ
jgi:hypothetical protein